MAALVSSGRELFMADASVFVDDAEAYEVYEREEESEAKEESVNLPSFDDICSIFCRLLVIGKLWHLAPAPSVPTEHKLSHSQMEAKLHMSF